MPSDRHRTHEARHVPHDAARNARFSIGVVNAAKRTMYFVLHPHGLNMSGRWVGLGYDGRIMSGWASMGQTREESETTMASLINSEGVAYVND
jgi:hypothetical protein